MWSAIAGLGMSSGGSAWVKPFVKNEVERREKIVWYVTRGGETENVVGVGVEVGSAWVKPVVKNEVEAGKILRYVTQGGVSENGIGV